MSLILIILLLVAVIFIPAVVGTTNDVNNLVIIIFFTAALVLYFSPSFVAARLKHTRKVSIVLLNFLLGWTVIGWIISLIWAYSEGGDTASGVARQCPFCAERIRIEAVKCKHCGSDIGDAHT